MSALDQYIAQEICDGAPYVVHNKRRAVMTDEAMKHFALRNGQEIDDQMADKLLRYVQGQLMVQIVRNTILRAAAAQERVDDDTVH